MADYDDLTVDDLREELRARELPTSGNKAELVARLDADDAADEEAPADEPSPGEAPAPAEEPAPEPVTAVDAGLVEQSGTVNYEGVRDFAVGVRGLADEVQEQLAARILQPLADFGTRADDPNSGLVASGGQRVASVVADISRNLQSLRAVAADMERDAVA